MLTFVAKRLLYTAPILLGVCVGVFLIIHLMPGDPARIMAGIDASEADVRAVRLSLDLDRPIYLQFYSFVKRTALGDLGVSFRTRRPVVEEVRSRYGNTVLLGLASILVAILFGGITGVASAVWRYSVFDNVCLLVSLVGVSMPTFALGLLLMLFFSVKLAWLPSTGNDSLLHFILPAITLGTPSAAVISRMVRSSLIEVLGLDYVRTARAKGLTEAAVIGTHALRNAMLTVVTVVGLQAGYLLGGAVVTESVFAWPGIGRLVVQSILARDFPVVQASILTLAVTFVLVNLATDLVCGLLDPRISIQ